MRSQWLIISIVPLFFLFSSFPLSNARGYVPVLCPMFALNEPFFSRIRSPPHPRSFLSITCFQLLLLFFPFLPLIDETFNLLRISLLGWPLVPFLSAPLKPPRQPYPSPKSGQIAVFFLPPCLPGNSFQEPPLCTASI